MKIEIECAAIRVKGDDGYWTGKYHSECMMKRFKATGEQFPDDGEQGFITNQGKYVSRKDAYLIAVRTGQLTKQPELFSEDLDYSNEPAF